MESAFQKELVEENVTNLRNFWNIIKDIFPNKTKGMPTNKDRNHNQPTIFSKYFANAVRCLKENSIPLMDFVWRRPVRMISRTRQVFKMQYLSSVFFLNELK